MNEQFVLEMHKKMVRDSLRRRPNAIKKILKSLEHLNTRDEQYPMIIGNKQIGIQKNKKRATLTIDTDKCTWELVKEGAVNPLFMLWSASVMSSVGVRYTGVKN